MPQEISLSRHVTALLASTFLIAACALGYELLIGSVSSYLLGNSVAHFSLTIGLFLSFMGVGSFFSKHIEKRLLDRFILIEIFLGLIGGFATLLLYTAFTFTPYFYLVAIVLIGIIGTLIGFEIPIMTRVVERHQKLSHAVAHVFTADYLGSLVASLAFALVFLPWFGLMRSALVFGLLNIIAAGITLFEFRHLIEKKKTLSLLVTGAAILLGLGVFTSQPAVSFFEKTLYDDEIIFSEQSKYQNIILTQFHDDLRMYLNGSLQFSSIDEYRYHEALVHIPMSTAATRESILILGGGDGLATREVLKYAEVQSITLVDLDPAVTHLAKEHPLLRTVNQNSLSDPRVHIINEDAQTYLRNTANLYSVILIDLPDPNDIEVGKLYTKEFYSLVARHLAEGGTVVTQATSPYFAQDAFWCIAHTMREAFTTIIPYHVNVPSFGPWGFVLASQNALPEPEVTVETQYLTSNTAPGLMVFDPDMIEVDTEINTLDHQVLIQLYDHAWERWYQR